tara:strand:+ start:2420 stop:2761 length:342 start_codon:yes stop_codon:yes gene_type:complete
VAGVQRCDWIQFTWRLCNKGLGGALDVDWHGLQKCHPTDKSHWRPDAIQQGPVKSDCFSVDCGGVSAAMGSSDSDADTFFVGGAFAYPLSCLLPVRPHPIKLVMACLLTNAAM